MSLSNVKKEQLTEYDYETETEEQQENENDFYDIPEESYALCCSNCTCSDDKIAKYLDNAQNCGNSGNSDLWHRGCCHDIKNPNPNYLSPTKQAIEKGITLGEKNKADTTYTISTLRRRFTQAKTLKNQLEGRGFDISQIREEHLSTQYKDNFRLPSNKINAFKVLDLFCGIGGFTLALKKLNLPIETIVHVDHDPVAIYVNSHNHASSNDGIQHIYEAKSYEDLKTGEYLKFLIKEYGPFHLVLAAPPSQLPSSEKRKDKRIKTEHQTSLDYMADLGKLIREVDEIQSLEGNEISLFFLCECSAIYSKTQIENLCEIYGGLLPIERDAENFGPCKRHRLYWTNIMLLDDKSRDVIGNTAIDQTPCDILEDGYLMLESVVGDAANEIPKPLKASVFMADKDRINDFRMIKVKEVEETGKYVIDMFSVTEREGMLGFPNGYVKDAVSKLFQDLLVDGFKHPDSTAGLEWRKSLAEDLHHFRFCKFEMIPDVAPHFFDIKVSTPQEGRKDVTFFCAEDYAKHLIGNSCSIPVIETIFSPLKSICESRIIKEEYDNNTEQELSSHHSDNNNIRILKEEEEPPLPPPPMML